MEAYRAQMWEEQPSRTFDELMLAYVRASEREKRATERDLYSLKRLYPFFTGLSLNTLSGADVRAYIDQRVANGAGNGTINRELGLLSSAINYARREWDWDISNPVTGRRLREPDGRVRWITRAEADAQSQAPYLADLVRLGLNSGMRREEMLGLEWRRVDLQANLIYLEASHQKSGRRGSDPLNAPAREAMLSRARFRARYCPGSPWVFCNRRGERIRSVKRSFAAACRRAGIDDFHPHDLRHTCAAWLVQAGVALIEVRDLLRHSTVRMTERYAHLAPHNVRIAVTVLERGESRSGHAGEFKRAVEAV